MRIDIKPLSVNECYRGRRFKTPLYKQYVLGVGRQLRPLVMPMGSLTVSLNVGFSSKGSDIDNIAKPFIDILQKKYGFNDNRVYKLIMEKEIVKKGKEYIEFEIEAYE